MEVACPKCGKPHTSFIERAREDGEGSRLDDCYECSADMIIEAHADGIKVFSAVAVPEIRSR